MKTRTIAGIQVIRGHFLKWTNSEDTVYARGTLSKDIDFKKPFIGYSSRLKITRSRRLTLHGP